MKIYRVDASQLQPKKAIVKIITLKQTVKVLNTDEGIYHYFLSKKEVNNFLEKCKIDVKIK